MRFAQSSTHTHTNTVSFCASSSVLGSLISLLYWEFIIGQLRAGVIGAANPLHSFFLCSALLLLCKVSLLSFKEQKWQRLTVDSQKESAPHFK